MYIFFFTIVINGNLRFLIQIGDEKTLIFSKMRKVP